MKNAILSLTLAVLFITGCAPKQTNEKIIVAYVGSGESEQVIDPFKMTHINYAFGGVDSTFDGVHIYNEAKLRKVVELKKENPDLKVMLSIGGWGAGGFSEMAREDSLRGSFVADCKRVVDEFGLDGIDMDWEYPSSSSAGIESTPQDVDNFTKLIKELRVMLGDDKLITFASEANANYVDFVAVELYLDFVNLMTYDIERPPLGGHHSALYPSNNAKMSVDQSVKKHIAAGLPKSKIVVGVPFYAHANTAKGYNDFESYPLIDSIFVGHKFLWDDVSKVPYVADMTDDSILCVYDNERSLDLKCEYVYDNDLKGVMYWVYGADGVEGTLRDAVYEGIKKRK